MKWIFWKKCNLIYVNSRVSRIRTKQESVIQNSVFNIDEKWDSKERLATHYWYSESWNYHVISQHTFLDEALRFFRRICIINYNVNKCIPHVANEVLALIETTRIVHGLINTIRFWIPWHKLWKYALYLHRDVISRETTRTFADRIIIRESKFARLRRPLWEPIITVIQYALIIDRTFCHMDFRKDRCFVRIFMKASKFKIARENESEKKHERKLSLKWSSNAKKNHFHIEIFGIRFNVQAEKWFPQLKCTRKVNQHTHGFLWSFHSGYWW